MNNSNDDDVKRERKRTNYNCKALVEVHVFVPFLFLPDYGIKIQMEIEKEWKLSTAFSTIN